MTAVLEALHEAREHAEMVQLTRKPQAPGVTSCGPHKDAPGFLGRFRELVASGEDADPTAVLCALVRCKAQEHAHRRGTDDNAARARMGYFLNSKSLTWERWWTKNLDAARAWLAGARPTAGAATSTDGSIVPGMEIQV